METHSSAIVGGVKLLLLHPFHRHPPALTEFLERALGTLSRRVRIEQAEVRVRVARPSGPRFQAAIFLRVPGPDLHASACDYSVRGAAALAVRALERQIAARAMHPARRDATGLRHRAVAASGPTS